MRQAKAHLHTNKLRKLRSSKGRNCCADKNEIEYRRKDTSIPRIRTKVHDKNMTFIEGAKDDDAAKKFEALLETQKAQVSDVTQLPDSPSEWEVSDANGLIDIYYLD